MQALAGPGVGGEFWVVFQNPVCFGGGLGTRRKGNRGAAESQRNTRKGNEIAAFFLVVSAIPCLRVLHFIERMMTSLPFYVGAARNGVKLGGFQKFCGGDRRAGEIDEREKIHWAEGFGRTTVLPG